jgi:hypothetical protein
MRICILLILLLARENSFGQFHPNSIGVAYLVEEARDAYSLFIAFPQEALEDSVKKPGIDTISYDGFIYFFDAKGFFGAIRNHPSANIPAQFEIVTLPFCDGHGGYLYKPTIKIVLLKMLLKREITANTELENMACFALVNRKPPFKSELIKLTASSAIRLRGDHNGDGQFDCVVWSCFDEARNCYGKTKGHSDIHLQIGGESFPLNFCGEN